MKRVVSLFMISALFFSFVACGNSKNTPYNESVTETTAESKEMFASSEEAVMNCIEVEYPTFEYEFSASAYKEFGREETASTLIIYALGLNENYRFEGGRFIVDNAYDYYPFITKLIKQTDNGNQKYEIDDHMTFMFDYTESPTDYHDYFPAEYAKKIDNFERLSDFGLTDITRAKATEYLKSIGRQAEIGIRPDFADVYSEDLIEKYVPLSVVEHYKWFQELKGFPLSTRHDIERITDGERYVYKCEYNKEKKLIIFTKYKYDNPEDAVKYYIDAKSGEFCDEDGNLKNPPPAPVIKSMRIDEEDATGSTYYPIQKNGTPFPVYLFNASAVKVHVDSGEMDLNTALEQGKVTTNDVFVYVSKAVGDEENGLVFYKDGGTCAYNNKKDGFTMIQKHALTGNPYEFDEALYFCPLGTTLNDINRDISKFDADNSEYDDWGLKMKFACQDGKTGTLSFQQSLNAGKPEGKLSTGAMYVIEANDNGSWISYEDYIRKYYDPSYTEPELSFITISYILPLDDIYKMDIDFTQTYGQLKPGKYRIAKAVSGRTYYAKFTVK